MIKEGSKVTLHYTLRVGDQVIESSKGRRPLTYVQGKGELIPGLEQELAGMEAGETRTIHVPADRGYGPVHPEAVQKFPRAAFQDPDAIELGDVVSGELSGHPFQATVTAISEDEITLDLNHPLAGKDLDFDVEIVSVE